MINIKKNGDAWCLTQYSMDMTKRRAKVGVDMIKPWVSDFVQ